MVLQLLPVCYFNSILNLFFLFYQVVKILNATDEHVMALGANFSLQADSHLVCMQSEQGYKTQAINIQNQARKGTLPLMLKLLYIFFLIDIYTGTVDP